MWPECGNAISWMETNSEYCWINQNIKQNDGNAQETTSMHIVYITGKLIV